VYVGGHAALAEQYLGLSGSEILYVGDHLYTDVHVSKNVRRWRTALVVRELEAELAALSESRATQLHLSGLMAEKTDVELMYAQTRLLLLRREKHYGPDGGATPEALSARLTELESRLAELDGAIEPLAIAAGRLYSDRWGLLMRTGADKSHFALQVENHADIYTSRVSNLLRYTPFTYFRPPRGSLPHDVI